MTELTLSQFRAWLATTDACDVAQDALRELDADTPLMDVLKSNVGRVNVQWLANELEIDIASHPVYAEYRAKCALLFAEYRAKCAPLDAEYEGERDLLWNPTAESLYPWLMAAVYEVISQKAGS